jgi:hypothetical protein
MLIDLVFYHMNTVFLLKDSISNGFRREFVLLGILAISCRNPVVSAVFLVGLFVNVASLPIRVGLILQDWPFLCELKIGAPKWTDIQGNCGCAPHQIWGLHGLKVSAEPSRTDGNELT